MLKNENDKIQEICEKLKNHTLEPALKEASNIVKEAELKAQKIIEAAKIESEALLKKAEIEIKQAKIIADASLHQAAKMSLESLKSTLVEELFQPNLLRMIEEGIQNNSLISKLIEAVIRALETEGLRGDVSVYIAQNLEAKEVIKTLLPEVVSKISLVNGEFAGGIRVRIKDKHLTIDITDDTLKKLMSQYIKRSEIRELLFRG